MAIKRIGVVGAGQMGNGIAHVAAQAGLTLLNVHGSEAKDYIKSGTFELDGELPVNTDGGLKTFGHPTGATGVRMIYENPLQLQGRAGDRQVREPKLALSHNIGGHPTACGIALLGRP